MHSNNQVYFVTGAAGFIGSYLCRALLKKTPAARVIGVDNINGYYNKKIKLRRIKELSKNSRFIFYKTSILEKNTIRSITEKHKPSVLIHAAAEVGVRNGELHPLEYFSTNVIGTLNVLCATVPYIQHAVVFSSSSVYGSTKHLPFRESEPIAPSMQLSIYGASKFAMEVAVQSFYNRTKIPITIVRPFSIYGPDGRPDMLPIKLLLAAKTNTPIDVYAPTKSFRDWTYIDDCVGVVLSMLEKPHRIQIINIGNGRPVRLDAILRTSQKILQHYGYSIPYKPKPANSTEILKTRADTTRMSGIYRLPEKTAYKEGFMKTAEFFFSHLNLYIS